MRTGLIFNVQRYSLHDGPGIRTTVFLKGCPLRCAWCHNPESISRKPEIAVVENRCIGCDECRGACPLGIAAPGARPFETCTVCGECVEACPTGGRQVIGREVSVSEVLEIVLRDRVFYDESGGGVTFSGGEPLVQFEFLYEIVKRCKEQGIQTVVDTSGFGPVDHLLKLAGVTDVFLYDLKLMDRALHQLHTGVSNELILANLQALAKVHKRIWVRVPLIPLMTDSESNLAATARFVAGIGGIEQVNILPYHKTGLGKAQRLGQDHIARDIQPPPAQNIEAAVKVFANNGIIAKIGG